VKRLRLWRDIWVARSFWKFRFVVWLAAIAFLTFDWFSGANEPFWIFVAAIAAPIVLNFVFWRSDRRTDREVKSRRGALVRDDL
jgi:hypothetical protein